MRIPELGSRSALTVALVLAATVQAGAWGKAEAEDRKGLFSAAPANAGLGANQPGAAVVQLETAQIEASSGHPGRVFDHGRDHGRAAADSVQAGASPVQRPALTAPNPRMGAPEDSKAEPPSSAEREHEKSTAKESGIGKLWRAIGLTGSVLVIAGLAIPSLGLVAVGLVIGGMLLMGFGAWLGRVRPDPDLARPLF